jgi:predicted ATPase
MMLSRDLWMLGFPDQSRRRSQQSFELAARLDIPLDLAAARAFGADINYYCGEVDEVDRRTIEVQTFLTETESEIPQLIGWTTMLEGWVKAQRGQTREAQSRIRDGFGVILASRNRVAMPLFGCLMANVQAAAGQPLEALATIDQTFQAAEETGQHYSDSELSRLRGEFLLMCEESDAGAAEECFRKALDIARRQQAKSWELRATMSLARLLANLGRRDEARTILAEIYGWFTEGFDTADLKEARALLDQLSR